jgi:hypothetical protein
MHNFAGGFVYEQPISGGINGDVVVQRRLVQGEKLSGMGAVGNKTEYGQRNKNGTKNDADFSRNFHRFFLLSNPHYI